MHSLVEIISSIVRNLARTLDTFPSTSGSTFPKAIEQIAPAVYLKESSKLSEKKKQH